MPVDLGVAQSYVCLSTNLGLALLGRELGDRRVYELLQRHAGQRPGRLSASEVAAQAVGTLELLSVHGHAVQHAVDAHQDGPAWVVDAVERQQPLDREPQPPAVF
jgi:hypothetical protein